jgi:hypothetical protein
MDGPNQKLSAMDVESSPGSIRVWVLHCTPNEKSFSMGNICRAAWL